MASERDDLTIHFQSSIEKLCEDHEDQFDKWHAERGYTTGRAKWKARALAAEAEAAAHAATISRLEAEVEAGKRQEPIGYLKPETPYAEGSRFIHAADRTEEWMMSVFTIPVYGRPAPPRTEGERA